MIHIVSLKGYYLPGYIDGWFINFFLYNEYGEKVGESVYKASEDLSSEMLTVPFKLSALENVFDCEFLAGFVGISQVEKDKSIKPQIHWLVRFAKKYEEREDGFF